MAITLKAFTSFEDLLSFEEFWKCHQWHPNADWDFYHVIVRTRSEVISPVLMVASENDKVIAICPGRIEATVMPIQFGYAKLASPQVKQLVLINGGFIGHWGLEACEQLIIFLEQYILNQQYDLAMISQVKLDSPLHKCLLSVPKHRRALSASEPSRHWLMQLPASWPEFLQNRSKKHRYWIKRLNNIMDRDFPDSWSIKKIEFPSQVQHFLNAAEVISNSTYHSGLGAGIVADEQNLQRLNLEAKKGQLSAYLLYIRDKPSAFWYCSIYREALHLCSTGYVSTLRHYELGTVLLMKVFQDHCGSSTTVVDFGLGDAAYKQRFGTNNFNENSFLILAPSFKGRSLRLIVSISTHSNAIMKRLLDRFRVTQAVKTFWRRRISSRATNSNDPNDPSNATG